MRTSHAIFLLFSFSLSPFSLALEPLADKEIAVEVKPFIESNTLAISLNAVDLNGDGLSDYVLVLEKKRATSEENEDGERSLLLLIRQSNKSLKLAKRNDKIVFCAKCGGVFGDPFEFLEVAPKSFAVHLHGGSSHRWAYSYYFNYSRRDNTWQLVAVDESSFHVSDPEKTMKQKLYKPPKHYGKIDIADFDPENYRGRGEK